ncbi:MAG: ATP-binding protein [Phycisphaerae bacterium]
MIRGFRHTLLTLLVLGVGASAALAAWLQPEAGTAIAVCAGGSVAIGLVCDRIAAHYLRNSLGRLRRVADDISRGRRFEALDAQRGDDFYKLVNAINSVAGRLSELTVEEQRLHEELRRREKLAFLGELAASVAHEVNNPLDGLQNAARILRRCLDDPQRARQMLDLIDSGLLRIDLIVRRLLTLAREHVIRPRPARLSDVVNGAIAAVSARIESSRVRVVRDNSAVNDLAPVDAPLLEQVFVNLILNALDAMPAGGELAITIREESSAGENGNRVSGVVVDVADRGAGIAPDLLPHIFEPFFTTKAGGRGTGLGLAIAARIVDAHEGELRVAPREGGGSVFSVRIPAAQTPGSDNRSAVAAEARESAEAHA